MKKIILRALLRRYLKDPVDLACLATRRVHLQELLSTASKAIDDEVLTTDELDQLSKELVDVIVG